MHSSHKIIFRCLFQPCSQGLSLPAPKLLGAGRERPWERGCVFWSVFLKTLNKKAITILKTDALQKTGDKFPNIKVTTSLRLNSMGTVTAQKN